MHSEDPAAKLFFAFSCFWMKFPYLHLQNFPKAKHQNSSLKFSGIALPALKLFSQAILWSLPLSDKTALSFFYIINLPFNFL